MLNRFFRAISRITLPKIAVIGFDIQETRVSGVVTLRTQGDTNILYSHTYDLPIGDLENGELKRSETLGKAIEDTMKAIPQGRLLRAHEPIFVLSIPPKRLYTETLFFPEMSEGDLMQAIRLKLETSLPWPLRDAYVDWTIIDTGDPERRGVFVTAISRAILDEYVKVFLERGAKVGACEFHLFSLIRFISPEKTKSFVFVLIDEDGFEFGIFAFGNIMAHYVQNIEKLEEKQQVLEDKMKQLTSYAETAYGTSIENIFIFDKLSSENLSSKLEVATGIPTQIFTSAPNLVSAQLSIAYGASLRPYSGSESLMNLLPENLGGRYQENLIQKTFRFWAFNFFVVSLVFLTASAGIYYFLTLQESALNAENAQQRQAANEKISQQQPLIDQANQFNELGANVMRAAFFESKMGENLSFIEDRARKTGIIITGIQFIPPLSVRVLFTAPSTDMFSGFDAELLAAEAIASAKINRLSTDVEKDIRAEAVIEFISP